MNEFSRYRAARPAARVARLRWSNADAPLTERQIAHRRRMLAHLSRVHARRLQIVEGAEDRAHDVDACPY
jgi:hypothetical protein